MTSSDAAWSLAAAQALDEEAEARADRRFQYLISEYRSWTRRPEETPDKYVPEDFPIPEPGWRPAPRGARRKSVAEQQAIIRRLEAAKPRQKKKQ